ncbi:MULTISPECIES: RNA polymerase sigma factor [Kitasatospora]|uniref:Putative RNA polymerase ECF subfamily sigma factor n=1 Tax=Kitasatospora setae (strain ATCC 33774 / DSM 43861 / JCM 3304 / KCC A-0304 / NBRC 14216 / KM-6054) TaxID=452652 RepID=E4NGD8_KITSK|nr:MULTISPECIES: RNA polymerase sigma factor [Kitasatospora]BAJ30568.1 putative RNA polymerase ECF subfamily sigma factor [Kitasatospora setae KM-6054]
MDVSPSDRPVVTPALIEAAKSGNRDAWADIYRRYHGAVLAFLLRRTGSRPLAEDLAQDTFVRAMAGIRGFHWTGTDLGAWMFTIARNVLLDHEKRRSTRRESAVAAVADRDSGVRVEESVIAAAEAERVGAALAVLNERQRSVLRLRYWDGLSSVEIADRTGLRVGAVKTLTYRARLNLRRSLARGAGAAAAPAPRRAAGQPAAGRFRESGVECSWKPSPR